MWCASESLVQPDTYSETILCGKGSERIEERTVYVSFVVEGTFRGGVKRKEEGLIYNIWFLQGEGMKLELVGTEDVTEVMKEVRLGVGSDVRQLVRDHETELEVVFGKLLDSRYGRKLQSGDVCEDQRTGRRFRVNFLGWEDYKE